jgi:hypothetical protein
LPVLAERASVKATSGYSNRGRDLVDTLSEDESALATVASEDLPEQMQKMSADERKAFVAENAKKRADIQQQIAKLSVEREAYLASEQRKLAGTAGAASLGDAVVNVIQKQLTDAGFENGSTAK